MILKDTLLVFGAKKRDYKKGDFVFLKGETPKYYYQIISGEIKMNNYNDNGKEFVQGIFRANDSFGEPLLFMNRPYPANAEVVKSSEVLVLSKERFLDLIKTPKDSKILLEIFAKRLYYKSIIASGISSENAEERVLNLLDYFKRYTSTDHIGLHKYNFTRQDIANLTGLRVETVIRTIKLLEEKGQLKIINRKVYR